MLIGTSCPRHVTWYPTPHKLCPCSFPRDLCHLIGFGSDRLWIFFAFFSFDSYLLNLYLLIFVVFLKVFFFFNFQLIF